MTTAQFAGRTTKEIQQIGMYGCTEADLRDSVENSITFKFSGAAMIAAGMMSDAQEEMAMGMTERARKTINCAKWILATYVMQK